MARRIAARRAARARCGSRGRGAEPCDLGRRDRRAGSRRAPGRSTRSTCSRSRSRRDGEAREETSRCGSRCPRDRRERVRSRAGRRARGDDPTRLMQRELALACVAVLGAAVVLVVTNRPTRRRRSCCRRRSARTSRSRARAAPQLVGRHTACGGVIDVEHAGRDPADPAVRDEDLPDVPRQAGADRGDRPGPTRAWAPVRSHRGARGSPRALRRPAGRMVVRPRRLSAGSRRAYSAPLPDVVRVRRDPCRTNTM